MRFPSSFFRATAICAAAAGVLVLVAQLGLRGYATPSSAGEGLLLYVDPVFRAQERVILLQVFLMFLGLWGAAAARMGRWPGTLASGFLLVMLWQVLELIPRAIEWRAVGTVWAPAYATDGSGEIGRSSLQAWLVWRDLSAGLGGARRVVWLLAHLLFGLAFVRGPGVDRILGALFLANALRIAPRVLADWTGWQDVAGLMGGWVWFTGAMAPLFLFLAGWLWWVAAPEARGANS